MKVDFGSEAGVIDLAFYLLHFTDQVKPIRYHDRQGDRQVRAQLFYVPVIPGSAPVSFSLEAVATAEVKNLGKWKCCVQLRVSIATST